MTIEKAAETAVAFLAAVLATALLASVVQTQINLAAITALGAEVPMGPRVTTTLRDAASFGPVMAAIAAAAFAPAFLAAWPLARLAPQWSGAIHALAAAAGLWTAFSVMGFFTPMPTLVAAVRGQAGLLAVSATGLVGGIAFARWNRSRTTAPGGTLDVDRGRP